jgi:cell volume regulation protein A
MAALDCVSIGILLGALLVLAGIMSSLVALRFGAPLLLVFLIVGMLAGEGGPGGIRFDDVHTTYVVGSIALALILFDGGLRTRFATFRNVLAPAGLLATVGVVLTAALTAPVARYMLGMSWPEALLVGAVVASTDAAAVFFLVHARGLRLRPRVGATLEVESGSNDPFAVLLTILLVEYLTAGDQSFGHVLAVLAEQAVFGTIIGVLGGRAIVFVPTGCSCRRACTRRSSPPARWSSSASRRWCMPRAFSRSISPASWSAIARPGRTTPWWCSSMPSPGWRRS